MKTIYSCLILLAFFKLQGQDQIDHLLHSSSLDETRLVSVSLPLDYHQTEKTYPVLFILDGEWVFDYAKSAVRFLSSDLVGQIPKMIVVGIPNIDRARDLFIDFKEDGSYHKFIDFLRVELLPFIQKEYRTNEYSLIYGWSSGGSISTYFMLNHPRVFDAYIESGSGLGPKELQEVKGKLGRQAYQKQFLYVSTEGETPPRVEAVMKYQKLFAEINPKGLRAKFEILEGQGHLDVLATGLIPALHYIFSDYVVPESTIEKGASAILEHFQGIDDKYSFEVEIPVGTINELAETLFYQDQMDEAVELLKAGMRIHSHSPQLPITLGQLYQEKGDKQKALHYYGLALGLSSQNPALFLRCQAMLKQLANK